MSRYLIPEEELTERFIRASGPGGQNVNKVSSAVELRFDLAGSPSLPWPVKRRLAALAGRRLTQGGEIVIRADEHRTLEVNRAAARARLMALVEEAAVPPKPRIATRPGRAADARRRDAKSRRASLKSGRGRPALD